jgi:transcriptional regulator with XRE-family HTH domain
VFVFPAPQPAKLELIRQRGTVSDLARRLGRNAHALGRVLNGYEPPSARLRREIAEALGKPEDELFHDQPRDGAA